MFNKFLLLAAGGAFLLNPHALIAQEVEGQKAAPLSGVLPNLTSTLYQKTNMNSGGDTKGTSALFNFNLASKFLDDKLSSNVKFGLQQGNRDGKASAARTEFDNFFTAFENDYFQAVALAYTRLPHEDKKIDIYPGLYFATKYSWKETPVGEFVLSAGVEGTTNIATYDKTRKVKNLDPERTEGLTLTGDNSDLANREGNDYRTLYVATAEYLPIADLTLRARGYFIRDFQSTLAQEFTEAGSRIEEDGLAASNTSIARLGAYYTVVEGLTVGNDLWINHKELFGAKDSSSGSYMTNEVFIAKDL
jgi:hypothetical protein